MRIAVVGDVLLDRDVDGPATRLAPDAPVPVVDVERSVHRAGGAGLVARMLARDGVEPVLVTVLGGDEAAGRLRGCLAGLELVAGPSGAPTPVKTRIRAAGQPVVRFDEGCAPPPVPEPTPAMLRALESADAVVVADYGRRLLEAPALREALAGAARRVPVVWDPHPKGTAPVPGAAAVTPNRAEALAFAGAGPDRDPEAAAAALLRERWGAAGVVVTLGARGALVDDGGAPGLVAAPAPADGDPCGAGDRFASALAVRLAAGDGLRRAAAGAVASASGFIADGGVAALAAGPVPAAGTGPAADPADPGPAADPADPWETVDRLRAAGGPLVATGGCFDLLHAGHARTLRAARGLGAGLVVCLNSDDSVRRLKGPGRPIMAAEDRVELLSALECVDAVLVFDEDTPLALLERLRPDVWVKGGDYDADALPEAALLRSWGGRCLTVPYHPARSTTALASALASVG